MLIQKPIEQASEIESLVGDDLDMGKLEIRENPEMITSIKKITEEIQRKSADFNK